MSWLGSPTGISAMAAVAAAICALLAVRADLRRRRLPLNPLIVTLALGLAALVGVAFPGSDWR